MGGIIQGETTGCSDKRFKQWKLKKKKKEEEGKPKILI